MPHFRFRSLVFLPILLAGFLATSFSAVQGAERNIVFFITDDESPTLGCYGDPVAVSPHADALAADGVLFRNAFATTASCSPSRSVVLSGLYNHRNGTYGLQHNYHHFESFTDVGKFSLPNVLTAGGYRTGQIGKYHVGPESAYHFETYLQGNARSTVKLVENCREFINSRDDDRPFFLYIGTTDPHRSGQVDETSPLELKPNLFGNRPRHGAYPGVDEVFFDPQQVPVPYFLPDNAETRGELAQYYQSCARIDQGLGKLVEILKEAGVYDKTLIVFTSDHGMAFPGAKTTIYDPGLQVPFIVRNPYVAERGVATDAFVSLVDVTPSLLDFAHLLNEEGTAPLHEGAVQANPDRKTPTASSNGGSPIRGYQGSSWLKVLSEPDSSGSKEIYASHTFHEVTMYYPMRAVRDRHYKLIWNIAHDLPFPFASDLWAGATWQSAYQQGEQAKYGEKTVDGYIHRQEFELYDIEQDPHESQNLAEDPKFADILKTYQAKLETFQKTTVDPWIIKREHE